MHVLHSLYTMKDAYRQVHDHVMSATSTRYISVSEEEPKVWLLISKR